MAALEQLEAAYDALRQDPRLLGGAARAARAVRRPPDAARTAPTAWPRPSAREARAPRPAAAPGRRASRPPPLPQARGPRPHRRPQDQQRARPGAADPAARQDPGHRRDRRRPARRRDGDGLRAARPAVRRLHGRRGHRAPGPERPPDAGARRRGPRGHVAARRRSRTRSTRRCATGSRTSRRPTTSLGSAMGPHPYPTIVRDLQRRIGDEAAAQLVGGRGPAAGPCARLRRRRLERDRAARPVHRRAVGPPRGRRGGRRRDRDRAARRGDPRRDAGHPPRRRAR